MDEGEFINRIELEEGYRFRVSFNSDRLDDLIMDEPEPLGSGRYPNAGRLLAAAVGNCMCASLLFCLRKARVDVHSMSAEVYTTLRRNERGRLRITSMRVEITPTIEDGGRASRCREIFEDFCIVSQSVREGVDISVNINLPQSMR